MNHDHYEGCIAYSCMETLVTKDGKEKEEEENGHHSWYY